MSEAKVLAARMSQPAKPQSGALVVRKKRFGMRPIPVSRDAQRVATAILEVLAGVRTPAEAATVVSLSLPRYYFWEQRALEGLVRACEPRPVGKVAHERHQIAVLEKEVARLRQDCARQQALVRASQRTIGLAASGPPVTKSAAKPGGKAIAKAVGTIAGKAKRKRRPVARALKAVAALQALPGEGESLVDLTVPIAANVVQRSVPSSPLATAETASTADHASIVPAVLEA
jgi:hypothetical protein